MSGIVTALMGGAHDEKTMRFRLRLYTALSFVLALVVGITFAKLTTHAQLLGQQKEAEVIVSNHSAGLQDRLGRSLSSTYALAAVLRQGKGHIDNFDELASDMLNLYGGLRSLQLAQDGVVSQVVPYAANAPAIGHDLLKDKGRNKEAFLAVETRRLTLAGPFELLQGGIAVVGRLPVFLPEGGGKEKFWGFTTAVIGIPDLLAACRLHELSGAGYHYKLAHYHPDSGKQRVFAQSGPLALVTPIMRTIEVPNGKWSLSLAPVDGWIDPSPSVAAYAGTLLMAFLVALFTHSTFKQPLRLRREVADRTEELAESNRKLSAEVDKRQYAQDTVTHINRLYNVLSRTNGAIVRITERDKLLEDICHIAVEFGGFPLARIALIENGTWQWTARCGDEINLPECNDIIHACLSAKYDGLQASAVKACVSAAGGSEHWSAMCPHALAAGFKSHVFLQLRVHGQLAGIFSLYANETDFFNEAQLHLLEEMTEDVSFALENLEREAVRKKTEEKLRKLSRAVEQSANAVVITNRDGVVEYVNPWFSKITGYTPEEIIGQTPRVLKSAETHPETHKRLWDTILSGKEWCGELHNTKKNGDLYWCLGTISPLKNEAGEITHFVSVTDDISERRQNEQTIRHLAFHDPLTGLPNRRLFNDRLHQAAAMRHRRDNSFALMLLDLDRFKTVNDMLGHDIGDALLKAVGARLQGVIRQGDTLARMGGDEFAVIALEISQPEDLGHLASKLLETMKAPFYLYGHELYVTTSMGVTLHPLDALDADALIKNADIALYRAKDLGRNNFQFFTGDMKAAMMQRLQLESAMRWAIERDEFMLHYQPQADVITGKISGTEALIRWRHPELGMVSPAQFIPLAEETGMIVQIGEWILRTACAQAKAWEVAGMPMRVAVNLSARQFRQGDLAEVIAAILEEFKLPARLLEVELTEGILMEDTTTTGAVLEKLHRMGVQISIDDFGTGYSSLSYLKRLPIQILKIDQSFVRDIHTDPDDRAIVTAVIALAHSMKLKVVAEGVETLEQLAFLREYRCDAIQGYLFSRPALADDVFSLMTADTRLSA